MTKTVALFLALTILLGFASLAAACPNDAAAAAGCPFHSAKNYEKKLAVGDKFNCAQCGMEGTVAADTPFIEHEGKYYYFMSAQCKDTFQKKVDEYYKNKKKP